MVASIGTALLSAGANAAVGAVTSKLAGGASSKGFSRAGAAMQAGTNQAVGTLQDFYRQTEGALSPYKKAGDAGLSLLEEGFGLSRVEPEAPGEGFYNVLEGPGDVPSSGNRYKTGTGPFPNAQPGKYLSDGSNIDGGPSASEGGYTLERAGAPAAPAAPGGFAASGEFTTPDVFDASSIDALAPRNMSSEDILQLDPGYQFRLEEGGKARERGALAAGYSNSGRFAKEMERYGQGFASNEFGNAYGRREAEYGRAYKSLADTYNARVADRSARFNKLLTLTGMGERATNTQIQAGQATASGIANAYTGQGAGMANLAIGQGSAQSGFINQAGSAVNNAIQGGFANYATQQKQQQDQANFDRLFPASRNSITGGGSYSAFTPYVANYPPGAF